MAEEARAGMDRAIRAYGCPFTNLMAFKYFGRILTASENDWTTVVAYLRKYRRKCARIYRILGQEAAAMQMSEKFLKTVVQSVLLFGYEMWLVTPHMVRTLGRLHHRVSHWITGKQPRQLPDSGWEYPLMRNTRDRKSVVYSA